MSDKLIKPSDLKRQAQELVASGQMPAIEDVLKAIADSRKRYQKPILDARKEGKDGG